MASSKEDRRAQILTVARKEFARRGYHATTIEDIVAAAGIARGTFYLYFESKAAVFDSILDLAMSELRGRIRRIDVDDPAAPPPQVQLKDGLVRVLDYVVNDRALTRILLSSGQIAEAEAAQRLAAFFTEVKAIIERALSQGMAMRLVRPLDTHLAAAALLGTVRGLIDGLVDGSTTTPVDEAVNQLIALALRGVLNI